jgi:hypothetical protein
VAARWKEHDSRAIVTDHERQQCLTFQATAGDPEQDNANDHWWLYSPRFMRRPSCGMSDDFQNYDWLRLKKSQWSERQGLTAVEGWNLRVWIRNVIPAGLHLREFEVWRLLFEIVVRASQLRLNDLWIFTSKQEVKSHSWMLPTLSSARMRKRGRIRGQMGTEFVWDYPSFTVQEVEVLPKLNHDE